MDHYAPLCEAPAHDFPVVPSCQQMPTRTKERRDNPEGREEPLRVPGRLETSHATFSFSRRLMGILGAIVLRSGYALPVRPIGLLTEIVADLSS